jgi:hypothetical protein
MPRLVAGVEILAPDHIGLQVRRIVERFGLSPIRAAIVAELAFSSGRRA